MQRRGTAVIEHDRELLARIARVNRGAGDITLALLHVTPDDNALADGFRELGKRYAALAADLLKRAEDLDGHPVDHVIINARVPETWGADKEPPEHPGQRDDPSPTR
jgi:hypothetical protein